MYTSNLFFILSQNLFQYIPIRELSIAISVSVVKNLEISSYTMAAYPIHIRLLPLILLIAALAIAVVVLLICGYRIRKMRSLLTSQIYFANQRLKLLRNLIYLSYVHSGNPPLFMKRFVDEVHINKLKCYDVVDMSVKLDSDMYNDKLTEDDNIIRLLQKSGFSPQELSVVYGMKTSSSMYVRFHRIRNKCRSRIA